ncbi:MAG: hypothetical protein JST54_20540 [Deltaproteobacteria bacterium]|nr:hypothetical protein [Deltaproteobacteria bacterium]
MSRFLTYARVEALVATALVASALVGLVAHVRFLHPPMVDDAGTSVAYALTFLHGDGLRLTPFSQAVEGYSDPLWVFVLALAALIRLDPVAFALNGGAALGVMGAGLASAWGPLTQRRLPRIEDAIPAAVAAVTTSFVYWISSGLEGGLQVFMMSLAGALAFRSNKIDASVGVALGLLALTRPEAALYAVPYGIIVVADMICERRRPNRDELRALGAIVLIVGGYELFRYIYFASLLPNTFFAKASWDFTPAKYLGGFIGTYAALCALAVLMGIVGVVMPASRRWAWVGLSSAAFGFFFAWYAHGDWMREWRFLGPLAPYLGAAVAAGLGGVREWAAARPRWASVALVGSAAVVAVSVGMTAAASRPRSRELEKGGEFPMTYVADYARRVEPSITSLGIRRPFLATPDLGGNSLVMRDAELVDDAGLADYAMARDRPNMAALEDYLLSEGPPDLVNAHGPSGHVAQFRKLLALYFLQSGDWRLRGLTADEDPRCPGGKKAVLALDAGALTQRIDATLAAGQPQEALMLWRCAARYQADEALPQVAWRREAVDLAAKKGRALAERDHLAATRYLSFATVLSGGNAWLRKETERQRLLALGRHDQSITGR